MSKLKKIQQLRKLSTTDILCDKCDTTIPMEFKGFILTSWFQPTKAKYRCQNCKCEKEVFYTKSTYFSRFSVLIENSIVPNNE